MIKILHKGLSINKSTIDMCKMESDDLFYCPSYSYHNSENKLIGIYRGQMKVNDDQKCVREGFGKYVDVNCSYIGYWSNDQRSGQGKSTQEYPVTIR
jgi:hypothetical protein